ncbi:hypothetical protein [Microcoleus sp. herbarium14]|uniref:hypothetical protein n=1 Tax=Microcoleus sp. herbarium14 TaxID=3055439 RepID=UPI002FD0C6EB
MLESMMEWKGFDLEGDRTSRIFKAGDRRCDRLQQIPLNLSKIRQPSSPKNLTHHANLNI